MTRGVIEEGFYLRHGFVVLPEIEQEVDENVQVIYPRELEYQKVELEKWVKEWSKIEKLFWEEVERYLPAILQINREMEVRVTRYGTVASGPPGKKVGIGKQIYYLRSDVDVSYLAAMIINNVLYLERKELGITWSKRESLMDFVMTRPRMKNLFPNFRPVMHQLAKVDKNVRKRSEVYLVELGLQMRERELEVMGNKLLVKGKSVKGWLTRQEEKLLKYLVKREGELITYDELADLKWGEGEFLTFWAISRQIGRVRSKLGEVGVSGDKIESVRGRGYIFSN